MTADKRQKLRVDLADWHGNTSFALYDRILVDSNPYELFLLGKYSGTAGQCCVSSGGDPVRVLTPSLSGSVGVQV